MAQGQELRCTNCRRKLGAATFVGRIEIVCHRCGVFNTFKDGARQPIAVPA